MIHLFFVLFFLVNRMYTPRRVIKLVSNGRSYGKYVIVIKAVMPLRSNDAKLKIECYSVQPTKSIGQSLKTRYVKLNM